MRRKLSNKTPEFLPPPTEIDLTRGIVNVRGFDVDAWTTEQALLTSLKSQVSLAIAGSQTAYRVHNANCCLGNYVFAEALLKMSERADLGRKWFSNYVVREVILYAKEEPQKTALPSEEAAMKTLPELVAEKFQAEQIIANKKSLYMAKTGALVIDATAGNDAQPSCLRITFNNKMFAAMRFVEQDMLPVITPKSGAILLNGAMVQAKNGFDSYGQVPAPCSEFDGAYVMPEVSYFDLPAIAVTHFDGKKLGRMKITIEKSVTELNTWRERVFGETDEKDSGTFKYRIDTADGFTARITFYASKPEILYEFEHTEWT